MNCSAFLKNISPFLDGELSRRLAARMESHLDTCETCRGELDLVRRTDLLLGEAPGIEPAVDFADTVIARVDRLSGDDGQVILFPAHHWRLTAALAAACLVLALSATFFLHGRSHDTPAPDMLVAELDVLAEMDFLSDLEILENLDSLEAFEEIDELEGFLSDIDDALENGS